MTSSISNILNLERTQLGAHCSSKKKLIQHISQFLSANIEDAQADDIYERLIAREKLGSTGIGEGIAIPHSRLEECDDTVGALFILDEAIDFDSIDKKTSGHRFRFIGTCRSHRTTFTNTKYAGAKI